MEPLGKPVRWVDLAAGSWGNLGRASARILHFSVAAFPCRECRGKVVHLLTRAGASAPYPVAQGRSLEPHGPPESSQIYRVFSAVTLAGAAARRRRGKESSQPVRQAAACSSRPARRLVRHASSARRALADGAWRRERDAAARLRDDARFVRALVDACRGADSTCSAASRGPTRARSSRACACRAPRARAHGRRRPCLRSRARATRPRRERAGERMRRASAA